MKNKVANYLSSKQSDTYSHLDSILKMYADGELNKELAKHDFYDIKIFINIDSKEGNAIQLDFKYFNLIGSIEFRED